MQSLAIIGMSIAAADIYDILHDMINVWQSRRRAMMASHNIRLER